VTAEDLEAVADVLRSGWLTQGPRTLDFELAFARQLRCEHAVAVSSCTAALHLAYLAAGVGPGDEVIVPSYTFAATAAAVIYCGATPVFADILGQHDLSIDPDDVAQRITPRTKAVTCVHFAGYPGPVRELKALCDEHGLALIEDAAHSPSATLDGRKLGTFGLAGCFSFFSNKILPSGEGGLLATDDAAVAELARRRRSHAMTSGTWERHIGNTTTYDVQGLGFNYRLDEPRAALLLSRMERLEDDIDQRRMLTRRYRDLLADIPGLSVPFTDEQIDMSSCYVMPVVVEDAAVRGDVRIAMRERHGVQTSLFYPSTHHFTAYRERFGEISLPRTELASATEITIPLYPHLTGDDQGRVVEALRTELARA
jgi:dTDP-4-amino-4,6-dideoxygalactose transaminase